MLVTSRALHELPDEQLRAVLAHEAGHHAGLHPIVLLAQAWMYRPIAAFCWLTAKLHNIVAWSTRLEMRAGIYIGLLVVIGVLRLVLFALRVIVGAASRILAYFGRRAEYRADRFALDLGYGRALADALETMNSEQPEEMMVSSEGSFLDALRATHPPVLKRIDRIREATNANE